MDYNHIILLGRLVRDPVIKTFGNGGQYLCEFTLAVGHKSKDKKEETSFFDCTVFGEQAKNMDKWARKPDNVLVDGRMATDTWKDPSGANRTKMKVIVNYLKILKDNNKTIESTDETKTIEEDLPF